MLDHVCIFAQLFLLYQTKTMIVEKNPHFRMVVDDQLLDFLSVRSPVLTREQALMDLLSRRVTEQTSINKNGREYTLRPGEAETSINLLAQEWKWDRKTVRRFLGGLQELGYIKTRQYPYGTIATFPNVLGDVPDDEPVPQVTEAPEADYIDLYVSATAEGAWLGSKLRMRKSKAHLSVRYDKEPLSISEEQRSVLRHVYDSVLSRLPLLHMPSYDERVEKALYYVFVLGMEGDFALMERFLDKVANDPSMNGEMAQLTMNPADQQSFESLLSSRWQELLFPRPKDSARCDQ